MSKVNKPSAILLDCDGTIFENVEHAHQHCATDTAFQVLRENGLSDSMSLIEQVWFDTLGAGILNFYETYIKEHQESYDEDISTVISAAELEERYEQAYKDLATRCRDEGPANEDEAHFFKVRKGLEELVEWAQKEGVPVAVISNATQDILETTLSYLSDIQFDLILGSDTVRAAGGKMKPSGDPYKEGSNLLGIDVTKAVGVEDTGSGLASLHSAKVGYIIHCKNCKDVKTDYTIATLAIDVAETVKPRHNLFEKITEALGNEGGKPNAILRPEINGSDDKPAKPKGNAPQ